MATKKVRAKQSEIPLKGKGVEVIHIKEIESAADKYEDKKDDRKEAADAETEAKSDLMEAMEKNKDRLIKGEDGGYTYRYGNTLVALAAGKITVKVTKLHDEALGPEED